MRRWLVVVALGVPVLAVAWWLGSPLFIDRVADEAFPYARTAVVPDGMTRAEVEQVMAAEAGSESEVEEPMLTPATPAVLKSGSFHDADSFHQGSGTATIYRLPDGSRVLRLEEFRVTNGPDLRVLLAGHPDPQDRDQLESGMYVELAELKGNIGNQNYAIPESIVIDDQSSVVIYCRPFHVIFSVAPLTGPAS